MRLVMLSRRAILLAAAMVLFGAGCATRKPSEPLAKPAAAPAKPSEAALARMEANNTAIVEARAESLAHYSAGLSLEMQGDEAGALEEYFQAAMGNPADERLALDVAMRLIQQQQVQKAYELLAKAIANPKASGLLYAHYGWVCQRLGKKSEAVAACQKAISLSPSQIAGYQTLFNIYLENKQPKEAFKVLGQAGKQPGDAPFLIDLAELYAKYNQQVPDEAAANRPRLLDLLDRARGLKPETIGYLLKLADLYSTLGETKQAADLYLQMQEKFASIPALRDSIRAKLTDLYLRGKDRKKAMEQLEAITKDYPLNAQAYYFLGGLAFEEKEYARAAEYLRKTILLNPNFEQGYYDTAAALINANQPKEALDILGQARKKFPQTFTLEYYAGLAHVRTKDYAEAAKDFTAAEIIANATDNQLLTAGLYFQIGAAMERIKRYDEAESYFQKSLDLNPNFAEALNYLGYMWAERGVNLDRARLLLERALKLEPNNGAFLDSMGWIYFKQGEHQRALEYVRKAVELNTEPDATLHDHLGDIYAALKQWNKAREQWELSLKLEPSNEVKKKLEAAPRD